LQSWLLKYPRDDVTCQGDACIPLANRRRHPYSKHDYSYLYATLLGKVFDHSDCLGQSKRQFGTRLKEHQKAVSTLDKGKSALAEHVCYNKHEIAWENSKVITTNNRYGQRLCLEAWHINMSNHALNRDDGCLFARGIHASLWQVTSSLGYLRSHD
jgi:hypothetical protein